MSNFKVGDKVVLQNSYDKIITTIDRVTKTRCFVGDKCFKQHNGQEYGGNWHRYNIRHATPEDETKILREREEIIKRGQIKKNLKNLYHSGRDLDNMDMVGLKIIEEHLDKIFEITGIEK